MATRVLLFYKYITIDNPEVVAKTLRTLCEKYHLLGRAIVAHEGINATFEGEEENTKVFVEHFFADPRFSDIQIKYSEGDGKTFPKLSVKVRSEIVGTRFSSDEANPEIKTGKRLSPNELDAWYNSKKEFVVVDMRNDYEYASGHFENSTHPGMRASRDLPGVLGNLEPLKSKTVVTVCTGGVRCEKMSAYLMSNGFDDVYQLDGGIHTYLEQFPKGKFKGALYTFDQRVTMDFTKDREIIGTCRLCGDKTERYVNCKNSECHLHFLACEKCQTETSDLACSPACKEHVTVSKSALV